MAIKTWSAVVTLVVHFAVANAVGPYWINAEEFTSSSYGVQIARRPVSVEQHYDPGRVLIMSSKVGQEYRCSLPFAEPVPGHQVPAAAGSSDGGETGSTPMTVVELLKPMESAPCLVKTKDWWTYEFCYGKEIRQFHLHNGQIQGDVISLGIYESDFEWTLAEQEKAKKSRLSRHHSQQYVNGTKCDLIGSLRKTEVRFYCSEGDVDRITAIAESQTCMYTLHVTTGKICSSTYLRPLNRPRPVTISCDPVVTEADYQEFLRREAEDAVLWAQSGRLVWRKVSLIEEAKTASATIVEKENGLKERTSASATVGADASKDRMATFQEILRATVEKQFGFDLGDFEMHIMDGGNSLEQVMDEVMKQANQPQQPGSVDQSKTVDILQPVSPVQTDNEDVQTHQMQKPKHNAPVETRTLRFHEVPIRGILAEPIRGRSAHADTVALARQGASEPSVGDVQPEETEELRQLREEIANMAVDVDVLAKYKDNIQHAVGSKFADILEEAVQELRNEGIDNDIDKEAAYKHMAASLASLLDGMSPHQKDRQRPAPHATEPTAAAAAGTVKDADAFAAGAAADAAEASAGGEQSNETPVPQGMPSSQPPAAVTPKEATPPASVVTVRIEPKVEVKIVDVTDETGDAASESNVDESVAVSHSEAHPEGRRIRTVVAILQPAGRDARKEEARQREMEENYNHLWSKKQKVEL